MRLIDADVFFENFPELAIEPYINAPTVESNISETYSVAYEQGFRHGKENYQRAFELACDLITGGIIYGINADTLFDLIMQEYGIVSTFYYQKFIIENLDRFSDDDEVRHKAIDRLGW